VSQVTPVASGAAARQRAETLLSIQVLRAIAALCVVVAHLNREADLRLQLPDPLPEMVTTLGDFGVDLFFVISGFIMVYVSEVLFGRPNAPQQFFLRRCARIVPLYWAASGILLVYVLLRYPDLASANFSIGSIVASFAFFPYPAPNGEVFPINGVGWTLNYEMFFYLIFSIALLASRRAAVLGVSIFFVAIVVAGALLGPLSGSLGFWTNPIIFDFLFGTCVALAFREGLRLPGWAALGAILGGVAAGVAMAAIGNLPRWLALGLPSALVLGGLVLSHAPRSNALVWRGLGFLGDASYALYLLHGMAMALPRRFFPSLVDPNASPMLYAALLLLVAVAVAIAAYVLFERPVTRVLQKQISKLYPVSQAELRSGEAVRQTAAPPAIKSLDGLAEH